MDDPARGRSPPEIAWANDRRVPEAVAADERALRVFEQIGERAEARVRVRREHRYAHEEVIETQERIEGIPQLAHTQVVHAELGRANSSSGAYDATDVA
jgi:hypothetical protein